LIFAGDPTRAALESEMLSDLRAGLEPSNIAVCRADAATSTEPVAILSCSFSSDGLEANLEVVDRVTEKRVDRAIKLARLPPDGRSLALAVESEELLRASWAELGLDSAQETEKKPPPAEIRAVIRQPARARRARVLPVGLRVALAHYGENQTQYGGDAFGLIPLDARLSLECALGVRGALSEASAHGTVTLSALSADLGLHLPWLGAGDFALDAQLSSHFALLDYRARVTSGATSHEVRGFAGSARFGLGAIFGTRHALQSFTTLGVGYPWLAFAAADGGQSVTGMSGFELYASSGLGVAF
jgi:hypothetical protein